MARTCVALFLATFLVTIPVAAQTSPVFAVATAAAAAAVPSTGTMPAPPAPIRIAAAARPLVLPSMYVSLGALQGYDIYSTMKALKQGGVEANPLMRGVVGHPALLIAVKGGLTLATIYSAERLWRQHRRGAAIALMAVSGGLMAGVAVHNASVLRAQR